MSENNVSLPDTNFNQGRLKSFNLSTSMNPSRFSSSMYSRGLENSGLLRKRDAESGSSPALKKKSLMSTNFPNVSLSVIENGSIVNNQSSPFDSSATGASTSDISKSSDVMNESSNASKSAMAESSSSTNMPSGSSKSYRTIKSSALDHESLAMNMPSDSYMHSNMHMLNSFKKLGENSQPSQSTSSVNTSKNNIKGVDELRASKRNCTRQNCLESNSALKTINKNVSSSSNKVNKQTPGTSSVKRWTDYMSNPSKLFSKILKRKSESGSLQSDKAVSTKKLKKSAVKRKNEASVQGSSQQLSSIRSPMNAGSSLNIAEQNSKVKSSKVMLPPSGSPQQKRLKIQNPQTKSDSTRIQDKKYQGRTWVDQGSSQQGTSGMLQNTPAGFIPFYVISFQKGIHK